MIKKLTYKFYIYILKKHVTRFLTINIDPTLLWKLLIYK